MSEQNEPFRSGTRCNTRRPPPDGTPVTVEIVSGPEMGMDVNPPSPGTFPGLVRQYRVKEIPRGTEWIVNADDLEPLDE